jgi:ribonucleoside-diphosphate reductase beta chain
MKVNMTNSLNLSSKIFHTGKTDYVKSSLFLGQDQGLVDSINVQYPELRNLYKKLKAQDWDEMEFDFQSCLIDFKTCSKTDFEIMLETIAWQWEADSVVSRSITGIGANIVSNSTLWGYWQRVGDNEVVHALTYSEMVKNAFEDPDKVMSQILSLQASIDRMTPVNKIFEQTYEVSHKLALNLIDRDSQDVYNIIFMYVCALLCLERIQFMASFTVTFSYGESGKFTQFAKAVQKICQDEYHIHSVGDMLILDNEMRTDRGLLAFNQCKPFIAELIRSVIQTELDWVNNTLFKNGREVPGLTAEKLCEQVKYHGEVYDFFRMEPAFTIPKKIPLAFTADWISIDGIQGAAQEEKQGGYLLGMNNHDLLASEILSIDI